MDDRSKCALGLGGVGVGWLALTPLTSTGMAVLGLLWLGLAIAWWFDESTFAVPVEEWREEGRVWQHLPTALLGVGVGWALLGTTVALAVLR